MTLMAIVGDAAQTCREARRCEQMIGPLCWCGVRACTAGHGPEGGFRVPWWKRWWRSPGR